MTTVEQRKSAHTQNWVRGKGPTSRRLVEEYTASLYFACSARMGMLSLMMLSMSWSPIACKENHTMRTLDAAAAQFVWLVCGRFVLVSAAGEVHCPPAGGIYSPPAPGSEPYANLSVPLAGRFLFSSFLLCRLIAGGGPWHARQRHKAKL